MRKRVVAHAIRGYLAHTETFVGNQVTALQHYRSAVVAHHRSPNREFDIEDLYFISDQGSEMRKAMCNVAYRTVRALMPADVAAGVQWLKEFSPALWHFHFAVDAAFFLPLYRAMGIPAVVSLYGYDVSSFPRRWGGIGRFYVKRVFDEMDCILAMSEDMKRDAIALGAHEEKIIVHYHGINADRFRFDGRSYCRKKQFTILCVGSLLGKKGQHHLLQSFLEMRKDRPDIDARVVLVGEGPLREALDHIIVEHGLQDSVELAGYVQHLSPQLLEYYRNADVFVHFSTTQSNYDKEGIPGTIVEAMASGLPVITTRHAGIPDVIIHGEHGILLDENDVRGLTESLIRLYDHHEYRTALGRAASRRALMQLDLKTKTAHLEKIYDIVTKNYRKGASASC